MKKKSCLDICCNYALVIDADKKYQKHVFTDSREICCALTKLDFYHMHCRNELMDSCAPSSRESVSLQHQLDKLSDLFLFHVNLFFPEPLITD